MSSFYHPSKNGPPNVNINGRSNFSNRQNYYRRGDNKRTGQQQQSYARSATEPEGPLQPSSNSPPSVNASNQFVIAFRNGQFVPSENTKIRTMPAKRCREKEIRKKEEEMKISNQERLRHSHSWSQKKLEYEEQLKTLKENLNECRMENHRSVADLQIFHDEEISQLNRFLMESQEKVLALRATVQAQEAEISKISNLENIVKESLQKEKDAEPIINKLNAAHEEEMGNVKKELEKTRKKLETAKARIKVLKTENLAENEANSKLENDLKAEQQLVRNIKLDWEKERNSRHGEFKTLMSTLDEHQKNGSNLHDDANWGPMTDEEFFEGLKIALKKLQKREDTFEARIGIVETEKEDLRLKLDIVKSNLEEKTKEIKGNAGYISSLVTEARKLSIELEEVKKDSRAVKEQNRELEERCKKSEEKRRRVELENEELRKNQMATMSKKDNEIETLRKMVTNMVRGCNWLMELEEAVFQSRRNAGALKRTHETFQRRFEEISDEHEKAGTFLREIKGVGPEKEEEDEENVKDYGEPSASEPPKKKTKIQH